MAQRSKRKKQLTPSRQPAQASPAAATNPWLRTLKPILPFLQAAIIVALGYWIYLPSLNGLWLWDDDFLIQHNDLVHDPTGIWYIWFDPRTMIDFMPLTVSVEWLIWQIWPNDPNETFYYHFTSLIFHLINAMLVWHLFRKLGIKLAWLGALLFTIHPVIVESVAWMAELKNTVGMPPYILALSLWISFDRTRRWEYYWASVALYLVAMLAKPTVVMMPVMIVCYYWWKHGRVGFWDNVRTWSDFEKKAVESFKEFLPTFIQTIPFFFIAFSISFALIFLLRHGVGEQFIPGLLGGPLGRAACAGLSLLFYFSKCILPIDLLPIYPQWPVALPTDSNPISWQNYVFYQVMAFGFCWPIMAFGFWWLAKRREHQWARAAIFGFGYFFLNLLPFVGWRAISFMRFGWVMDHFLYVPALGLFGLAAAAAGHLDEILPDRTRILRIAGLTIVLAILAIGSHRYSKVYVDRLAYWTYTAHRNFVAWPAHNNRGNQLLDYGRYDEAEEEFKIALALNPVYTEAHNNLGYILSRQGHYKEAEAEFLEALKYTPDFESAQLNLQQVLRLETMQVQNQNAQNQKK